MMAQLEMVKSGTETVREGAAADKDLAMAEAAGKE